MPSSSRRRRSRDIQLYELNTLNIDATGQLASQRSTFADLHDNTKRWNLNYLTNLGCNWLWFQPIHPDGIDGRQDYPNTSTPYNVGSPYAVKNFFEIMPLMGNGDSPVSDSDPNANDPSPVAPTDPVLREQSARQGQGGVPRFRRRRRTRRAWA